MSDKSASDHIVYIYYHLNPLTKPRWQFKNIEAYSLHFQHIIA